MIKLPSPLLKRLLISVVLFCPILSSGQTILEIRDGYYIAAAGDVAWHNNLKFSLDQNRFNEISYDIGQGTSFSIGKICRNWRLELEGAYRKSNVDRFSTRFFLEEGSTFEFFSEAATGFIRDFSLMLNGYWDVYVPCSWWIFYIGGGVGVSFQERQFCASTTDLAIDSNTLLAWQGMTGFAYEIIEHVFLNLGYRIFMTAKPRSTTQKADDIVLINNIEMGVRIELW